MFVFIFGISSEIEKSNNYECKTYIEIDYKNLITEDDWPWITYHCSKVENGVIISTSIKCFLCGEAKGMKKCQEQLELTFAFPDDPCICN